MSKELLAIKYAMNMEKRGKKFYEDAAASVKSKSAEKIFKWLSEMENEHLKILEAQYNALSKGETPPEIPQRKEDMPDLYEERKKQEGVKLGDEDILSDMSVLRMAFLIEQDFANFYKNAAKKAEDPKERKVLESLALWEEGHRDLLREEYDALLKESWFERDFQPF